MNRLVQGMNCKFCTADNKARYLCCVADGGKEIAKHLAALSRTLKANKVAPAWRE